jgi:hypothetical protein
MVEHVLGRRVLLPRRPVALRLQVLQTSKQVKDIIRRFTVAVKIFRIRLFKSYGVRDIWPKIRPSGTREIYLMLKGSRL